MALSVTQSHTEFRFGSAPTSLTFNASGNTGTVNWSTSSGSLSSSTGLSTILSPFNRTELVVITAQDDVDTVIANIQIWGTLPGQPQWGIESDVSSPIARWPLTYERRSFQDYWTVLRFFHWHQRAILDLFQADDGSTRVRVVKGKVFYLDDLATGELLKVYFDSAFRRGPQSDSWVDFSFQVVALEHA